MAKEIVMNTLTENGYEDLYPFSYRNIIQANFVGESTATNYVLQINNISENLQNLAGNNLGLIAFIPTITNGVNCKIVLNGAGATPIQTSAGVNIGAGVLKANELVIVKFYNGSYRLITSKDQLGLNKVQNLAPTEMPVSNPQKAQLDKKLNTPVDIGRSANLNTFIHAGLFRCPSNDIAATVSNSPIKVCFSLFVEKHDGVKQTLTESSAGNTNTWVRNQVAGTWGAWQKVAYYSYGTQLPSTGYEGQLFCKIES